MEEQTWESGWRALSLYTGASIEELRTAAITREFEWTGDMLAPVVTHEQLDAWLMARSFGPQLIDDLVQLAADLDQAS